MQSDLTRLAHRLLSDLVDCGVRGLSDLEDAVHARVMSLGLLVMKVAFERMDSAVATRAIESGARYKAMHGHRCLCRFGSFRYSRTMVQAVRNGAVWSPLAAHLHLPLGFVTASAAQLTLRTAAGLSTRAATALLAEFGEVAPSRTTLMKLVERFGDAVVERRTDALSLLAREAGPPGDAVSVSVQLDGVMVQMVGERRANLREKARDEGRKAGGPIGKEECSVGALSYYDANGDRLRTVRVARMPERGKTSLKADLATLLAAALEQRPDLTVVAGSDGAPNHWTFLTGLKPDFEVVDFYHASEHIQRRLNSALGVATHENQQESARLRKLLLDGQHVAVFADLEQLERNSGTFKERKKTGRGAQPTFYERHADRMDYAHLRDQKLPIGTGVIEGTARYVVVDRLRQTGMRWKAPGGQAILDLRCAVVNGIYRQLWRLLEPDRPVLEVLVPS